MARRDGDSSGSDKARAFHRVILRDFRGAGIRKTLRQDFRDLYRFYVDEEQRAELQRKGRIRRAVWITWHLLKSLILRLSPARRLLLLVSLYFAVVLGDAGFTANGRGVNVRLGWIGYVLALLVLMLELKDKLLARDEIEVARQVQRSLLPREHPRVEGWSVWSVTRPANDVGGDLVDYVPLRGGRLGVVLGDVAGKGMGAALLAAKLQASLRAAADGCGSVSELGTRLNTILHRGGLENRYATLCYSEIEPRTGRILHLNAGHNPAFVVRAGAIEQRPASALPLGMFEESSCAEDVVDLAPGDLFVAYSDGLTEARDAAGEEFGEGRLRSLLPSLRGLSAEDAGARLLREAEAFLGPQRPQDDLSIAVILRTGEGGPGASTAHPDPVERRE